MNYILYVTIYKGDYIIRMILNQGLPIIWLNGILTEWERLRLIFTPEEMESISKDILQLYTDEDELPKN